MSFNIPRNCRICDLTEIFFDFKWVKTLSFLLIGHLRIRFDVYVFYWVLNNTIIGRNHTVRAVSKYPTANNNVVTQSFVSPNNFRNGKKTSNRYYADRRRPASENSSLERWNICSLSSPWMGFVCYRLRPVDLHLSHG